MRMKGLGLTGLTELHYEASTDAYAQSPPSSAMSNVHESTPHTAHGCAEAARLIDVPFATRVTGDTSSALRWR